jgi:hypothetical protein
LRARSRHHNHQQQAERVHQNVPFAPINILSGSGAMLATTIRRRDALRVKNRCRRLPGAPFGLAQPLTQTIMDAFPHSLQLPQPEVVIDDSPARKLMWQQAPRAARAHDIEDCIENLASGILRRTTEGKPSRCLTPLRRWIIWASAPAPSLKRRPLREYWKRLKP